MRILDALPYQDVPSAISVGEETIRLHAHQVIVWVSINMGNVPDWDLQLPQIPAILDPGNNHNFSITRGQLSRWGGLQPTALPRRGTIKDRGQRVPLHAAKLWLHPNLPGESAVSAREPYPLNVTQGIAIYPDETGPRLPLLGLRALTQSRLRLTIDGDLQRVWVHTLDWRTRLMRLIS